jgi:hypothetical protein
MKNLTKTLLFICLIILSTNTFSQKIGAKAGFNFSNMVEKDDNTTLNNLIKPGIHLGAIANIPLMDMISLEPGIQITTKGARLELGGVKFKTNLTYLEFPILGKFTYKIGDLTLVGIAGPAIGIGLSGKAKSKVGSDKNTESISWGNDKINDDYKRLDLGFIFGAGIEMDKFQFTLSYNLGLANISPYTDYGTKVKNRVICLSAAYFFTEL